MSTLITIELADSLKDDDVCVLEDHLKQELKLDGFEVTRVYSRLNFEPLKHHCPECAEDVPVILEVGDAESIKVPLMTRDGHVYLNDAATSWISGDYANIQCRCKYCGCVFSEAFPNEVEEFEKDCKEYEESTY